MAASEQVAVVSSRPPAGAAPLSGLKSRLLIAVGLVVFFYVFPLFHVVPIKTQSTAAVSSTTNAQAVFDPAAAAAKIWKIDLPAAIPRAVELRSLVPAVRENAESAKTRFAKAAGLGTSYFFLRGSGKVVSRDRNYLRIIPDGSTTDVVAVRIGPIFGNVVRDGSGLLDVNSFPGLQEFNDLSGALNALVEKDVLPALREKAIVGATVHFAGCAEAPESAAEAGEPILTIIPIHTEVK